jgi:hypothetical protein
MVLNGYAMVVRANLELALRRLQANKERRFFINALCIN